MVERGEWVWLDSSGELAFQRSGHSLPTNIRSKGLLKKEKSPVGDKTKPITLEDVKKVAVGLISDRQMSSMSVQSTLLFDHYYRTGTMDQLLWSVLKYFQTFLGHKQASEDEAITIQGILGDSAREKLQATTLSLHAAQANLSAAYMALVSGLGAQLCHHSLQGRLKYSRSHIDRELFEAIYEFALFTTYVAFERNHWELIRDELGRLFRTSAFNRDVSVTEERQEDSSTLDMSSTPHCSTRDLTSSEHITHKAIFQRPATGQLSTIRSPAVSYFYHHPWSQMKTSCKKKPFRLAIPESSTVEHCEVGIIGEQVGSFDPLSLRPYSKKEEDETGIHLQALPDSHDDDLNSSSISTLGFAKSFN